MTSNKKKKR